MKRVAKDEINLSDIDTKDENRYIFIDKILKIAYDININNHHDKNATSQITISSKFNNFGIDINHTNDILKEIGHVNAKY